MLDKPVEREYRVTFWACNIDGHRHKKYQCADKCIANQRKPPKKAKWDRDKCLRVVEGVLGDGKSCAKVGQEFSVTGSFITYILSRSIRRARVAAGQPGYDRNYPSTVREYREKKEELLRLCRQHLP